MTATQAAAIGAALAALKEAKKHYQNVAYLITDPDAARIQTMAEEASGALDRFLIAVKVYDRDTASSELANTVLFPDEAKAQASA